MWKSILAGDKTHNDRGILDGTVTVGQEQPVP